MRPTDRVFEEEVFLHLFSSAPPTDRVLKEEVFFCLNIYLVANRPMDTEFWKKKVLLHLFSGATGGHSF